MVSGANSMNQDEQLMRFWLEHEYTEEITPYLICSHPNAIGPYGQHEWLICYTNDVGSEFARSHWNHRPRYALADFVSYLIRSGHTPNYSHDDLKTILDKGQGLSFVADQIIRLEQDFCEDRLQRLLQLCMGAQYFSVVAADYFPFKNHPSVKLARFYAYVALDQQDNARTLYKEIESLINSICCQLNSTAGLVFSNIRCLYLLRSGINAGDVLAINQLLVAHSTNIGHETLAAILLLNQARLNRILGNQERAISLLEESFGMINDITSFKLRLYYVLQLALIKGQQEELLDILNKVRNRTSDVLQCFGWRIAKQMVRSDRADMILGAWSRSLSAVLMRGSSVNILLKQLLL